MFAKPAKRFNVERISMLEKLYILNKKYISFTTKINQLFNECC